MKEQLMQVACVGVAGMLSMVIHELPKSILYIYSLSGRHSKRRYRVFLLCHYIDPIGFLLCITTLAGFSKPYMFRMKEKSTNFKLGIIGFFSLALLFCASVLLLKWNYPAGAAPFSMMSAADRIVYLFYYYLAYVSLGMFIVNLFPISTFDMGLLIAGKSPSKYFSIIQGDFLMKTILILTILMGVIPAISGMILNSILR